MYLEKLNEFFLHHPMCTLDVACECVRTWDLCLGMEHGKDLVELLIVDNGVQLFLRTTQRRRCQRKPSRE